VSFEQDLAGLLRRGPKWRAPALVRLTGAVLSPPRPPYNPAAAAPPGAEAQGPRFHCSTLPFAPC